MSAAPHTVPAPIKHQPVVAPKPVSAPPSGGSWKWLILAAIIGIVAFFGYRYATKPAPASSLVAIKTAKVAMGNLERTIRVGGQTQAVEYTNVTAPALKGPDANREMILLSTATPGSWVKKGTKVAVIDSQSLQDHVDDLGDTVQAAEADVRKRQAEQTIEWETLQQNIRITKTEADKARLDFRAAEVRTDIERQLMQLAMDEADAAYKQAQGDLDLKKQSHAAELKILEYTLLRHTRHRDRHVRDVAAFTIFAPMDGLVVMSQIWRGNEMGQVQQGDRLFPGQRFMQIVNTKAMQVEGNINQAESSEFRVGQVANVKLDAFPELEFKGEVYTIGALAAASYRQSAFIRNVPIRVRIIGSDPRLIPDLSASADVVIERANNQLLVPRSALHEENGKTVAYVKNGDKFDRREVSLGVHSDNQAVVLAGLNSGDLVRIN